MAHTPEHLLAIKRAERLFYERCFAQLITSVAIYVVNGKMDELSEIPARGVWIDDRAMRSLERWRAHFAPERIGQPLEFVD